MCAFTVTAAGEPLMMLEGADGKEQLYFSFGSPADAAVWREVGRSDERSILIFNE